MGVNNQHEMMQEAFLESKDIINQIFKSMKAPEDWQIQHMTFDELVGALYKILGIWNGEYRDDVTVTPDDLLKDVTAYDKTLSKVVGNIPSVESYTHIPGTEDKVIIESKTYVAGEQILVGCPDLKPENIRKDINMFGVVGTMEEGSGTEMPQRDPATATSEDIIKPLFAYDNQLEKVNGTLNDKRNKVADGSPTRADNKDLYISPTYKGVYNNTSELTVPLKDIGRLLDIDPSKIESGYEILGVIGTKPIPNDDTDNDGEPNINLPVSEDDAEWIDWEHVRDENKNDPVYLNADTDNDKLANINIDTDDDGKPELNIDTDKDGKPDVNIDINDDGLPELNIDTDGDYRPDINIDLDRDGIPDTNIDSDNDGIADTNVQEELHNDNLNIDTNDDGIPDLNIDDNNDQFPDINIDTNDDGKPELNIDTNDDGKPDVNIDTNNDGIPDLNIDDDGDGIPDRNVDTNGDGIADVNIDTNHDGKPDKNIDSNHDGVPDKDEKGKPHDSNDDSNSDYNADTKDARMEITDEDLEDSKVNEDDIREDSFDEDDDEEDNNPDFENGGDEGKDDDHKDLIETEDEDGNKQYVPNPTLQWAYSDYYLPMIYPTTQIHRPEKYATPVELTKDQDTVYSVITSNFTMHYPMTYQHAKEYPWAGETFHWLDDEGNIIEEFDHDQTVELFKTYELAQVKNEFDQNLIQASADGNIVWLGGVSGSYQNWADNPGTGPCIYMDANGKWHRSNGTENFKAVYEKKNTRRQMTVTKSIPIGQKTTVQDDVNAAMIPLVRYAITQETRAKMYHYGNDTYLDNTTLSNNIKKELPNLKQQAVGSIDNILPPKGVYANYMEQWKNPQGKPGAVYPNDYVSDAYTLKDGDGIEKPDYVYFQHNNYIEDALKLYKRLGKIFEKNGEVNSYSYSKLGGGTLREAPTANIEGESLLQVYVADLRMTPQECYYIWRSAFNDYADYLPVWCMPLYTTIEINDTIYETQIQNVPHTYTKNINDIETVNSDYSDTEKQIIEFTPAVTFDGVFKLTMNSGHWYYFKIFDKDELDADPNAQPLFVGGQLAGKIPTHSNSVPQTFDAEVIFEAGKTYVIKTLECPYGGTDASKFVYSFALKDDLDKPVNIQVQYTVTTKERVQVPKQVDREIVEHMYLSYYPEDFRQECFQDMEDTFQDLTEYVKQYVGKDYTEQHVGNIFERGSTYTSEEKKKIAKCIHDYLIVNNAYDYGDEMNQTIYPAMSRGKRSPVCASYSLAFKYCCSRYGIVCHITMGICDPYGEYTDEFGGRHMWNRITYEPSSFTERQYLHYDGKIVNNDRSMTGAMNSLIVEYDSDNRSHYMSNNKFFFNDSAYEGNDVKVLFTQSHKQYDKAVWSDIDVTWDDPSEPGTDVVGNTNSISWEYFNVDSSYMKTPASGSRIYTKTYMTDTGVQCYANLVGQNSHQDQYPSGKSDRYNGSTLYGW